MEGAGPEHDVAGKIGVVRKDTHHERALAPVSQRNRIGLVLVRHEGRNRTERFDVVHGLSLPRTFAAKQDRRQKSPLFGVGASDLDPRRIAVNDRRLGGDLTDFGPHGFALCQADKGAHPRRFITGIADGDLVEPRLEGFLNRVEQRPGGQVRGGWPYTFVRPSRSFPWRPL